MMIFGIKQTNNCSVHAKLQKFLFDAFSERKSGEDRGKEKEREREISKSVGKHY